MTFWCVNLVDLAWLIGPILPLFSYCHMIAIWGLSIRDYTRFSAWISSTSSTKLKSSFPFSWHTYFGNKFDIPFSSRTSISLKDEPHIYFRAQAWAKSWEKILTNLSQTDSIKCESKISLFYGLSGHIGSCTNTDKYKS